MTNQTFYIFRHGLATYSKDGYGDQTLTAGILPEAYPSVEKLADFLSQFTFDHCLTSPVLRCRQTAEVVSQKIHQQFIVAEELTEYWPKVFPPFQTRMLKVAASLQHMPYQHIAICTHGGVIAGLSHLLLNEPFAEENLTDHPKPPGLVIVTTGNKPSKTTHSFA